MKKIKQSIDQWFINYFIKPKKEDPKINIQPPIKTFNIGEMEGKLWRVNNLDHRLNLRYFTVYKGTCILLANCTERQSIGWSHVLLDLLRKDMVIEIDLNKETWIYPHLYLPLKKEVYSKITTINSNN